MPTLAVHPPGDDDDDEGEDLGVGEVVLHSGGPAHLVAVDEAEEAEAGGGQQSGGPVRRVALREERLQDVQGEGQALDGRRAGTDDDALHPQADESQEGTEGHPDVGVVRAGLADHAA